MTPAPLSTRRLSRSGLELTTVSFGTASIGGLYRACDEAMAEAALSAAWGAGIRYFDTAPYYGFGLAEERLGRFLAGAPREDVVISTKVGRVLEPVAPEDAPDLGYVEPLPNAPRFDYSHDGIMRSYEASLERLRGRAPDILYVHDIGHYTHGEAAEPHYRNLIESGFRALERLQREAGVKAVGLGVNETEICERVLAEADIDVILLAGRYSLLDRSAERSLLDLCRKRRVDIVAAGVFNSGILATGAKPGAYFDYGPASDEILARVERLDALCRRHGVPLATASLQFPGRSDVVVSTLLGTAKVFSLERNLKGLAEPVPHAFWAEADAVAREAYAP